MGLDAYMFARDFVPQIQEAENAVIGKLGLSGLKTSMDEISAKLPGLGEITKMITGEDKETTEKETTSGDSIKYTVKGGKVDPESLEEGVPLEKAQQHYYKKQIDILNFKIKSAKRKGTDTSEMEKKLAGLQSKYNDTLEFGGYNIKGNANNIVSTNGVSKKANNISNYDDEEETIIIKSGSETGGDVVSETENNESLTPIIVGGGGGDREIDEALYKRG